MRSFHSCINLPLFGFLLVESQQFNTSPTVSLFSATPHFRMKQPFSDYISGSKRKGKEAKRDSSLSTAASARIRRNTMHGTGHCGTCQPGPSCILFPRRADGKVVLPIPRDTSKPPTKSDIHSGNSRPAALTADCRTKPYRYSEGFTEPTECVQDSPPSRSHKIESYAQLSSLPEFKAFRMDQNNGESRHSRQSTRQQATNATERSNPARQDSNSSLNPNVNVEWQQWKMREIRVVKRRRKQEYIRSGTHDFSIRLWSNYEA